MVALFSNVDHALAFHSGLAVDLMDAGTAQWFDRVPFNHLRNGHIRLARDRLIATGDPDATTDLLCTTISGARLLQACTHLRLVSSDRPG